MVRLLGHLAVYLHGEAVVDGLRSRAKMLLVWYLLRPEGATSEQAVDALWPDTTPDQVGRQFWRAFGDLRTRLRDAGGDGLDVLVKAGDHYQPATQEITCDLWDFQAALKDAAGVRADLHRRAIDAHLRLAELEVDRQLQHGLGGVGPAGCNQENLHAQVKSDLRALHAPVNTLNANWAYMTMAAIAWNLKACCALLLR